MEVRIAILGAGHLGGAVIEGLLRSGVPASSIQATARPASRAAALASTYGIRATDDNAHAASRAMTVLLAVPPRAIAEVVAEIAPKLRDDAVVVSLAAGVPIARIEELLRPDTPVVRAMTNTAASVDAAMTVIAGGGAAAASDLDEVEALFARLGEVARVDESAMPLATAVAGSGPALVFHLAAAMTAAARAHGMDATAARAMIAHTVLGAASSLVDSDASAEEQLARVATAGGTTRAALDVLDEAGTADAVRRAIEAAAERARELA